MNSGFLMSVLTVISALTSLFVEGIKKILDERQVQYSSNVLAICVAFGVTVIGSILYIIWNSIPVTSQVIVTIITLVLLSFLVATVGYDKVKQLIHQIGGK